MSDGALGDQWNGPSVEPAESPDATCGRSLAPVLSFLEPSALSFIPTIPFGPQPGADVRRDDDPAQGNGRPSPPVGEIPQGTEVTLRRSTRDNKGVPPDRLTYEKF